MPNLSIKNVPEGLLSQLRERASRHHRSLQGELMALLSAAVETRGSPVAPAAAGEPPNARRSGSRRIEDIAAEHRARWKRPFNQGARAVDVIRADRNAR
ncbi:MAG TPA: Arc family DNA-binding protein [Gammaproteobacteria bacterium]|nr:Arc family DNA-binding protein [Gammaproteobacteria bacterium]